MNINHIHIGTRDLKSSVLFYQTYFGFKKKFCLDNEAEVIRIYDRMKSDGVSMARDLMKEPNEFASFFALDPDGYKIEVSWHNE